MKILTKLSGNFLKITFLMEWIEYASESKGFEIRKNTKLL